MALGELPETVVAKAERGLHRLPAPKVLDGQTSIYDS